MRISKMRGLAAGAMSALAVLGTGGGVAAAAPAVWNTASSGPATIATPLVLKVTVSPSDTRTVTCAPGDVTSQAYSASNSVGQGRFAYNFHASCTGLGAPHTVLVDYYGPSSPLLAEKNGTDFGLRANDSAALVITGSVGYFQSNYNRGGSYLLPFVNGTNPLAPASTVTYNNTQVGKTSAGQPITLTGTLQLATSAGGLLTLS